MEILVIVITFALCFAVDKFFSKFFRGKPEHQTGLAVRLNKMYGVAGLLLTVLGIASVISGVMNTPVLLAGGILVILMGLGLIVYYLTFGIYYGDDTFLVMTFGKKSNTYHYRDIRGQKLYVLQGGNMIVELHLINGQAVQVQSNMDGMRPFLDKAYGAWLRQTGTDASGCGFHDPAAYSWFPGIEEE